MPFATRRPSSLADRCKRPYSGFTFQNFFRCLMWKKTQGSQRERVNRSAVTPVAADASRTRVFSRSTFRVCDSPTPLPAVSSEPIFSATATTARVTAVVIRFCRSSTNDRRAIASRSSPIIADTRRIHFHHFAEYSLKVQRDQRGFRREPGGVFTVCPGCLFSFYSRRNSVSFSIEPARSLRSSLVRNACVRARMYANVRLSLVSASERADLSPTCDSSASCCPVNRVSWPISGIIVRKYSEADLERPAICHVQQLCSPSCRSRGQISLQFRGKSNRDQRRVRSRRSRDARRRGMKMYFPKRFLSRALSSRPKGLCKRFNESDAVRVRLCAAIPRPRGKEERAREVSRWWGGIGQGVHTVVAPME